MKGFAPFFMPLRKQRPLAQKTKQGSRKLHYRVGGKKQNIMSKLDEIGEILQLLQSGNLTDEEIKALANRKYSHKETLNENQYDRYRGMQFVQFEDMYFPSKRFIEYCDGQIIDSGNVNMDFHFFNISRNAFNGGYDYKVEIINNTLKHKLISNMKFDKCLTANDRLMLLCCPEKTNADIPVLNMLKCSIRYTRTSKYYTENEPVVCCLFTINNAVEKISFSISNPEPERLIEFM